MLWRIATASLLCGSTTDYYGVDAFVAVIIRLPFAKTIIVVDADRKKLRRAANNAASCTATNMATFCS